MLVPLDFVLTFFLLGTFGVVPSVLFSCFLSPFLFDYSGLCFRAVCVLLALLSPHVFVLSQFSFGFLQLLFWAGRCAAIIVASSPL